MQTKWRWMRRTAVILSLSLIFISLTACNFGGSNSDDDVTRVLKIATIYGDDRNSSIRSQYTDLFAFANDNIEIEVISAINYNDRRYVRYNDEEYEEPDPVEEMKKLLESSNPPDVVMLDYSYLSSFIEDNPFATVGCKNPRR